MNRLKQLLLVLVLLAVPAMVPGAAFAVTPDEVLDDPVLEARARALSKGLRCLVCRNENIDDSHADLARDLRLLVRERLVLGDSDQEVLDFVVDRYGEYVLLKPTTGGANMVLWLAGPGMLLIALGVGGVYVSRRRRAPANTETALNDEEEARLASLLGTDPDTST